jgi:transposase
VLRLKWTSGLSNRAIARSCRISHSTVSEYLARAEQAGLNFTCPNGVDGLKLVWITSLLIANLNEWNLLTLELL